MQCYQCHVPVIAEAVFCHRCGARLEPMGASASLEGRNGTDLADESVSTSEEPQRSPVERFRDTAASRAHGVRATEETLWEGRYCSKAMVGRWLLSGIATVGLLIGGVLMRHVYVWLAIAAMVVLLWSYQFLVLVSRRWSVHYKLTNQRFVHEAGVLRRVTDRIELIDMNDIAFEQGMIERVVGVGTIHISSNDRSHPELTLPGIEDVAHVAALIDETYRAERRRRGLIVEGL